VHRGPHTPVWPGVVDVNVVSATDTGHEDKSHKPVRHWYLVKYEA